MATHRPDPSSAPHLGIAQRLGTWPALHLCNHCLGAAQADEQRNQVAVSQSFMYKLLPAVEGHTNQVQQAKQQPVHVKTCPAPAPHLIYSTSAWLQGEDGGGSAHG